MRIDLDELRRFVSGEWERIMTRHHYHTAGVYVSGQEIMQEHTQLADTVIRRIFGQASEEDLLPPEVGLTVVALGGYGRGELNPHSDIDIMLLFDLARCPRPILEKFSSLLIATLWDASFEVGHSVRTLNECRSAARSDAQSRTAMLEGRYIVGSRRLYQRFEHEIKTRAMRRGVRLFIGDKIQEWRQKQGDPKATIYVQEPDLKSGPGGLREVHVARWVARSRFGIWELPDLVRAKILPENAVADYEMALDFIWRVRNELHYLSKRRHDVLALPLQEKVAKGLGYQDRGRSLAEEQLMRDYYRHAQWIHECSRIIIMQSQWEWSSFRQIVDRFQSKTIQPHIIALRERLRLTPDALETAVAAGQAVELLMDLFVQRSRIDLPLAILTRHQIVALLPVLGKDLLKSRVAHERLFHILSEGKYIGATLRTMHELGVLEVFLPEFEDLRALVRYDFYHKFTVDEHTLVAVESFDPENMASAHHGQSLLKAHENLEPGDRVSLRLATLLHDIGKGTPGEGGHVEKGAKICLQALERFPLLSQEQKEDVLFLVDQHLLMSHTAQRRDLDDPTVIERFAKSVGSSKRAKLLSLLTYADIRAVNPELWTDWTATLLHKLYVRTESYFRGEVRLAPAELDAIRGKIAAVMGAEWESQIAVHFERMGSERMAFYSTTEIAAQTRAVAELDGKPCVLKLFEQSKNYSSVVVTARDRIGLFARIAGVLAADDVNILSADLNTRTDGIVVDTLHVADANTGLSIDEIRIERLTAMLTRVLSGELSAEDLLEARRGRRTKRVHRTPEPEIEPLVRYNNEDSRDYTILDVRARDRVGLLYTMTHTLSGLNLNISLAKISTEAYRAVDVFYVADEQNRKIRDEARLNYIVEVLKNALMDTSGF